MVDLFCKKWGESAVWKVFSDPNALHEANFLKLDCSKIKKTLGWKPIWSIDIAIEKTVQWSKKYLNGGDIIDCINSQIIEYMEDK